MAKKAVKRPYKEIEERKLVTLEHVENSLSDIDEELADLDIWLDEYCGDCKDCKDLKNVNLEIETIELAQSKLYEAADILAELKAFISDKRILLGCALKNEDCQELFNDRLDYEVK